MSTKSGTVVSVVKGAAIVRLPSGDDVTAAFGRSLVQPETGVVVGDLVTLTRMEDVSAQTWALETVHPRRSVFSRVRGDFTRFSDEEKTEQVIAANIDLVVMVVAAAHPPFRPRQLDRYLILAEFNDLVPVICLNKIDLGVKLPDLGTYEDLGYMVVRVSAATGDGLDELRRAIAGRTSVFVGSSGVGKSSLLNALVPGADLATGNVGRKSPRGRHTTTRSSLFQPAADTTIIDTPGIRALEILEIGRSEVHLYFRDLAQLAPQCRFNDCLHLHEPDCAVREAVEAGGVSRSRYESYLRVMLRAKRNT